MANHLFLRLLALLFLAAALAHCQDANKLDGAKMSNLIYSRTVWAGFSREEAAELVSAYEKSRSANEPSDATSHLCQALKKIPTLEIICGEAYIKGIGVSQSYSIGSNWLLLAARAGNPDAQLRLGALYQYAPTSELPPDATRGEGWEKLAVSNFKKAADGESSHAQHRLGDIYLYGWGVKRDINQATSWFQKAANQGDVGAQTALGIIQGWNYREQVTKEKAAIKEQAENRTALRMKVLCALVAISIFYGAILLIRKMYVHRRRIIPKHKRTKQLAVMVAVGLWCTICCFMALQSDLHPLYAALRALLYCIPGLISGIIGSWWLRGTDANNKS